MNYGKIVCLKFDGKVYNVSNIEKTQLRLINTWGEYMYPISVTYGANDHEVYLHFDNINTFGANKLECLQTIAMGSEGVSFGEFLIDIYLYNLLPRDLAYMEVVDITVSGDIAVAFDGKGYFEEEGHLQANTILVSGENIVLVFKKGYLNEIAGYLEANTISVSGEYCDINGVPL